MNLVVTVFYFGYVLTWIFYTLFQSLFYLIKTLKNKNIVSDDSTIPVSVITEREADEVGDAVISLSFCPGRKKGNINRNLEEDLLELKKSGVTIVVSLVQQTELDSMNYSDFDKSIEKLEMQSLSYPIRDHFIPTNIITYNLFINDLHKLVKKGERIHIHCNGGRGRATLTTLLILSALNVGLFKSSKLLHRLNTNYFRNPLQVIYAGLYSIRYFDLGGLFYKDTCRHSLDDIQHQHKFGK